VRIVIITGMSGSGKSTAVRSLEDEGFFCLDNLPMQLLQPFIDLAGNSRDPITDVALVIDIRARDFLRGREDIFQELRDAGHQVEILFLDASDQVLVRRFSETRRRHPALEGGTVPEGIRFEREQLAALHRLATIIIDTSELNVHQLRDMVMRRISEGESGKEMVIHLQSFGFRYGLPLESDLVMDVRFLPNPYFVEELKPFSGLEPQVRDFVLGQPETKAFLDRFRELLDYLVPGFVREGKSYLTISIGCTGGRHRSVAITQALGEYLCAGQAACRVSHRDIDRG